MFSGSCQNAAHLEIFSGTSLALRPNDDAMQGEAYYAGDADGGNPVVFAQVSVTRVPCDTGR